MDEVRFGTQPFSNWFAHATVIPATLFADFVNIDPKTATMEMRGSWRDCNFSTASPVNDRERDSVGESHKSLDNLYYIQLLSNELPSFHFWSYADPIGNSRQMCHGLISKGTSACYDIEGENMISNIHINFNRMQNLPLRNGYPFESEQVTNGDLKIARRRLMRAQNRRGAGKNRQFTGPEVTKTCLAGLTEGKDARGPSMTVATSQEEEKGKINKKPRSKRERRNRRRRKRLTNLI
jgi:hypothetical protein